MNKSILLLAGALTLGIVAATAQNKVDKQGRKQGHWVRTDKDGSKIFEGDFVDGQETGTFTYFYSNGAVRMRNTFVEPGKRCNHEAYDEQGHLLAKGMYNQRNRDGKWLFYAADGRLVKEASYRMGVKEGQHVIYTRNGDTAEVTNWQNNHRHGRWWKRIGTKGYITASYTKGLIEGRLVEYDDNNRLTREGFYVDGLKHGTHRYYSNDTLTIDELWQHGSMNERRILLCLPEQHYESVFDIACLAAQGKNKVLVYLKDGRKLVVKESADRVFDRLGNGIFMSANNKNRIMVARHLVQGLGKDSEGRDILIMEPQPDFPIFPDEDGIKMIRSRQYEDNSPLEQILNHED